MLEPKILAMMLPFLWRERVASAMGQRAKNRLGRCIKVGIQVLTTALRERNKQQPGTDLQGPLWGGPTKVDRGRVISTSQIRKKQNMCGNWN